jgi:hypothetical protein
VLLAGEDVPVKSLTGKLVRTDLAGKQGELLPRDLPRFPVRQWLQFLAGLGQDHVVSILERSRDYLARHCAGNHRDSGAKRMVENYAGLLTAWKLLCDFCKISTDQGGFIGDLVTAMNQHITETSADREPWVWILDTVLNEIARRQYHHPYKFTEYLEMETGDRHPCLLIRPTHIMAHISGTVALRDIWNGLPVKTPRVLKQQLIAAEVVYRERIDTTVNNQRATHMLALSIDKLAEFNLHPVMPSEIDHEDSKSIDSGDTEAWPGGPLI